MACRASVNRISLALLPSEPIVGDRAQSRYGAPLSCDSAASVNAWPRAFSGLGAARGLVEALICRSNRQSNTRRVVPRWRSKRVPVGILALAFPRSLGRRPGASGRARNAPRTYHQSRRGRLDGKPRRAAWSLFGADPFAHSRRARLDTVPTKGSFVRMCDVRALRRRANGNS